MAGAGVGPLLTIWDRTAGKQNVRGVASLGNIPYYLTSINPAVKTIADFILALLALLWELAARLADNDLLLPTSRRRRAPSSLAWPAAN